MTLEASWGGRGGEKLDTVLQRGRWGRCDVVKWCSSCGIWTVSVGHTVGVIWSSNLGFGHNLSDDAIWTTRLLIICTISSQGAKINTLTSFSYDSLIGGCISFKCQLLTVNFVGFGCQSGFRLHTSGQSLWQSCTQIQAVLVIFFSLALASQPLYICIF